MITDKPTPDIFEKQCITFLLQSLNNILDCPFTNPLYEEYCDNIDVYEEDYWRYHQGILQNTIVLLFLSLENYLKMKICEVSSLLLIDSQPREWKSLNTDKRFDTMYIKQFDDLIILYVELGLGIVNTTSIQKLIDLKEMRNQIMHGIVKQELTPNYYFEILYDFLTNLWNDSTWWIKVKEHLYNEPLFGDYDTDFEKSSVIKYVDLLVKYIGLKKTGEILGVNLKQRLYYCPYCHSSLNHDFDFDENRYAILKPNSSRSTKLFCIICNNEFDVIRESCKNSECKGNVISDDGMCLTCLLDE